nr:hypothetical protein [Tanacetum cinerariifolium]
AYKYKADTLIPTSHLIPTNSTATPPSSSINELIHDCNLINIETHNQTPLPPNASTILPFAVTNFCRRKRGRHRESLSKTRLLLDNAAIISTVVKENQEKDKIGSKPDKNGKRGEAGKSLKQL